VRVEGGGPVEEGSVYVERAKPGLREGEYRWRVTAFDRPRRAVHSHRSGGLDADLELPYEPLDDDRARYTQVMRFRSYPRSDRWGSCWSAWFSNGASSGTSWSPSSRTSSASPRRVVTH